MPSDLMEEDNQSFTLSLEAMKPVLLKSTAMMESFVSEIQKLLIMRKTNNLF